MEAKDSGESKRGDDAKGQAKGDYADSKSASEPIEVTSIDIEGDDAELTAALALTVEFELTAPLRDAHWVVRFTVDSMNLRQIVELGETDREDYVRGGNTMEFECATIDVAGIRPGALTNAGLLGAVLMHRGEEVLTVNCVVDVKNVDGTIRRVIYNPLE